MKEWRIKEISEMTKTSIRMLRHYDKIGLLKPSYRSANGYRCYTENDLAKLQQIIALKYFGFNLETIKSILQKHQNIYAHLQAQQQVLKDKAIQLQHVNNTLQNILERLSPSDNPDWNDLINLIERYHMTVNLRESLKKTWAGQLSEAQFEEYLFFYEKFPKEFSERDRYVEQINNNELGDPAGPDGERVSLFMHTLAKKLKALFTEQVKFGSSVLESMKSGKLTQLHITPEGSLWLSKAMSAFWLKRWDAIYDTILNNLNSNPEGEIGQKIVYEWTNLINDYFSTGSKLFLTGILLWQETARQSHEIKETVVPPSPQDMVKPYHIKLLFNPEAVSWISRALEIHAH